MRDRERGDQRSGGRELLRTLEDLEILEVGVFGVDVELDTRHWDVEVDRIEDLAKSSSASFVSPSPP